MIQYLAMLSALSLLTLSATAHAQNGPTGFRSPSKNIACQYFSDDGQNVLRCDIMQATVTARRPADCDSIGARPLRWLPKAALNDCATATR